MPRTENENWRRITSSVSHLIVPLWLSSRFWPLLTSKYRSFIKGCLKMNGFQVLTLGKKFTDPWFSSFNRRGCRASIWIFVGIIQLFWTSFYCYVVSQDLTLVSSWTAVPRVNDTDHVKGRLRPLAGKDFYRFEQGYWKSVFILAHVFCARRNCVLLMFRSSLFLIMAATSFSLIVRSFRCPSWLCPRQGDTFFILISFACRLQSD